MDFLGLRSRSCQRLAAIGAAVLAAGGCASTAGAGDAPPALGAAASGAAPNIVFVLTDDLSDNLVRYMPHVLDLERRGMTFTNYTVTDSLCCPSRASILTGEFPHDTKVVSNVAPNGGWSKFTSVGDENDTFATSVSAAGYRTALFGKYLNGYVPMLPDGSGAYIPRGWTNWGGVNGGGYQEYNYRMAVDSAVRSYGSAPADYLTSVMTTRATKYVTSAADSGRPFLLELATFAPHAPYVPAPQDLRSYASLAAPRPPSFGVVPTDPPRWMQALQPLSDAVRHHIDVAFQRRVQSVQSVDRMLGAVETALQNAGQLDKTVIVFSSDNGFHMGEHDLRPGKQTAFDTDIHVPLIVAGPGVAAGAVSDAVVENVDLAPTFDELAGATPPSTTDGRSLVPLLHGQNVPWRTLALIEHHGDPYNSHDPDSQTYASGNAPSYDAIRSADFTFIRYRSSGEREYYDRTSDPYEMHNVVSQLSPARIKQLDGYLNALRNCHGATRCWQAGQPN